MVNIYFPENKTFFKQKMSMIKKKLQYFFLKKSKTKVKPSYPHSSVGKESACNVGGLGSISGMGRSPREGNGRLVLYSCLENPMDRGVWRAKIYGVPRVRHDLATRPPPPSQLSNHNHC